MTVVQASVTHDSKTQIVETTAPSYILVKTFQMTESTDELIQELKSQGYATQIAHYGLTLNFDEK